MQILLVEDDVTVAELIISALQDEGLTVEHVANGRDGLFLAASKSFDLIILDRLLPGGVDGLRIMETLRAEKNSTPILFLTGLGDVKDRIIGLKAGADDYLPKPFAISELLARIDSLTKHGKQKSA